jgi:hypothetical protein
VACSPIRNSLMAARSGVVRRNVAHSLISSGSAVCTDTE